MYSFEGLNSDRITHQTGNAEVRNQSATPIDMIMVKVGFGKVHDVGQLG
ncbi:hypothetical protein Xoosp13_14 [Xanthomonas phage Xoo-sp13]|nr:hypothetical protein Xoosp13_14 [Xanthomonas phage Xoo-sp13]